METKQYVSTHDVVNKTNACKVVPKHPAKQNRRLKPFLFYAVKQLIPLGKMDVMVAGYDVCSFSSDTYFLYTILFSASLLSFYIFLL